MSSSCSSTDAVAGLRQFSANQNSHCLTPYAVGRLACGMFAPQLIHHQRALERQSVEVGPGCHLERDIHIALNILDT